MNRDRAGMNRLCGSVVVAAVCLVLLPCCASVTTISVQTPGANNPSQDLEALNDEIRDQRVTIRMKSGDELIAEKIQLRADSSVCELALEHRTAVIPTDSISEIVNSDINLGAFPRPTV